MLVKLTVKGQELSVGYKQEEGALTTVPGTPDKASGRFARGQTTLSAGLVERIEPQPLL